MQGQTASYTALSWQGQIVAPKHSHNIRPKAVILPNIYTPCNSHTPTTDMLFKLPHEQIACRGSQGRSLQHLPPLSGWQVKSNWGKAEVYASSTGSDSRQQWKWQSTDKGKAGVMHPAVRSLQRQCLAHRQC